jgi:predicted nucleic acid-binding protein
MAGENRNPPHRVLVDTNIVVIAYSVATSAESQVLRYLGLHRNATALLLSDELQSQILRVAKRIRDKDWAGLLLSYLWNDLQVEYVVLENAESVAETYQERIPRKDLLVFLTAMIGRADCFISRNRQLLRAALGQDPPFECLTPEEFLAKFASEE